MGMWQFGTLISSKNRIRQSLDTWTVWFDKQNEKTKWDENHAKTLFQLSTNIDVRSQTF